MSDRLMVDCPETGRPIFSGMVGWGGWEMRGLTVACPFCTTSHRFEVPHLYYEGDDTKRNLNQEKDGK